MKRPLIFDLIEVNENSATPKYLQLTKSILRAIDDGKIKKDDLLPSINELSFELDISRRTAEKGYAYLKKIGIIGSVPGKAFFIKRAETLQPVKIMLLFNKLSAHKKIIYDSLVKNLHNNVCIDLHIYNNDSSQFKKLLMEKKEEYTYYVIIPFFEKDEQSAYELIDAIPKEKLILLDKKINGLTGHHAAAYENFENDIYHAMSQALEKLSKYEDNV
jgi:DNA-binding transcriptional regulator YhcF (GntR family)